MLSKNERLTKNSEFAFIYRKRKSVANSLIIMYVGNKKIDKISATKVGFVVGKKVSKKAVKRNRIKRLMREAYKNVSRKNDFKLKDTQSLIFLARPAIVESDYNKVVNALLDCVNKASKRYVNQNRN